jgi:predicted nucleic acid-binding protein
MRYVIDASVAVEYLLRTQLGQQAEGIITDAELYAPSLFDVEIVAVLRRAALQKRITAVRAELALKDLATWPVQRIGADLLTKEAWKMWQFISAYDAFYVATARRCEAVLLTADGPLSRASGLGVVVHNIRLPM